MAKTWLKHCSNLAKTSLKHPQTCLEHTQNNRLQLFTIVYNRGSHHVRGSQQVRGSHHHVRGSHHHVRGIVCAPRRLRPCQSSRVPLNTFKGLRPKHTDRGAMFLMAFNIYILLISNCAGKRVLTHN